MKSNRQPRHRLETIRWKIELQGFACLADAEVRSLRWWLKLAPASCLVWLIAGMWRDSPLVIGSLIPFAFLGAVLPWHPFDAPYQWFIRRWINAPAIPRYGAPRRFACALATVWLGGIVWAMVAAQSILAYSLSALLVLTAAMPVLFDFCVPSFVYRTFRALLRSPHSVEDKETRASSSQQILPAFPNNIKRL